MKENLKLKWVPPVFFVLLAILAFIDTGNGVSAGLICIAWAFIFSPYLNKLLPKTPLTVRKRIIMATAVLFIWAMFSGEASNDSSGNQSKSVLARMADSQIKEGGSFDTLYSKTVACKDKETSIDIDKVYERGTQQNIETVLARLFVAGECRMMQTDEEFAIISSSSGYTKVRLVLNNKKYWLPQSSVESSPVDPRVRASAKSNSHDDVHANALRKVGNKIADSLNDGQAKVGYFPDNYYYVVFESNSPFIVRGTRNQRYQYMKYYCPGLYSEAWDDSNFPAQYKIVSSSDISEGRLHAGSNVLVCTNPR